MPHCELLLGVTVNVSPNASAQTVAALTEAARLAKQIRNAGCEFCGAAVPWFQRVCDDCSQE